ncbi:MAG: deoxyribodipyrimidine photolyase [Burkholderiales bacterium PBB2]|nr:MAG: deoxyribodipyrimidine photolyase [Burkholderiales bacterium PBB2]
MRPLTASSHPFTPTALVWFKRDLRLLDHAPLVESTQFERAAALLLIEPEWLQSPECEARHVEFLLACAEALQQDLARIGLPLIVRVGSAVAVLEQLRQELGFSHLLSHEETGTGWSYVRDIEVSRWCRACGVAWQEWPQTGVVRRLKSRSGWAALWAQRMDAAPLPRPLGFKPWLDPRPVPLPGLQDLGFAPSTVPATPAGERAAWQTLGSFLEGRGRDYRSALSSPLTAAEGCSRLSAHLAFGTISMRLLHQATERRIASTEDRSLAYGLRGFSSRLRWHCHFMQKLEDEPALEWRNLARAVDGLRPGESALLEGADRERFQAWCEGRTGYPMVDACMRQLRATGWLNFRMRAMLVSFAAYHLWLHWREPGLFLARQFLDFEPGIHWSQMQMQSGTTGINTLRIYSPAKQAREHDPLGEYQRRWLPELGTAAYPAPIVDERAALARAKEALYGQRRSPEAQAEAERIQDKHGSRKSGLPSTARPSRASARREAPSAAEQAQQSLF